MNENGGAYKEMKNTFINDMLSAFRKINRVLKIQNYPYYLTKTKLFRYMQRIQWAKSTTVLLTVVCGTN